MKELWNPNFDAWFDQGAESEDAALIVFKAQLGEYWDTSGLKRIRYAIQTAKASITGEKPDMGQDHHGKLVL